MSQQPDRFSDPEHLKREQYRTADKLAARIRLHALYSTNPINLHTWFFDRVLREASTGTPGMAVLEVGAGRGDLWAENGARIPANWTVTLSDFSEGMLRDCAEHIGPELAARFTLDVADVQRLPYPDAQFDRVFANYMLYHVPDRVAAVRELRRVLKPDGILYAMTNGDRHMAELFQLAGEYDAGQTDYETVFRHSFSLQNGEEQLRIAFDQVERIEHPDSLYVTDVGPLVDYIASMIPSSETLLESESGRVITARLADRIRREGGITIHKETGLFRASGYARTPG